MRSLVRARLLSNAVVNAGAINALTFTASSRAIHHLLTSPRQVRAMAQRSVSRIHEGDLPLQDANGASGKLGTDVLLALASLRSELSPRGTSSPVNDSRLGKNSLRPLHH